MTLMAEKPIKVTRTEALENVVRVIRHALTKAGIDPARVADEDIEGVWNQVQRDAAPGTYGAAWVAAVNAWCDETQTSARPLHRHVLNMVRGAQPKRSRYQAAHRPIKVAEVECPEIDAFEPHGKRVRCTVCGRVLQRRVRHQPGEDGKFGYIEHYRDGSTYFVEPA